ncbi:hypothetical protein ACVTMO_16690 [Pseudomonas segetis]
MNKPHIKKLSKGSMIFECASRESGKGSPFCIVSGHGFSPGKAFYSWQQRRAFLIERYTGTRFAKGGISIEND